MVDCQQMGLKKRPSVSIRRLPDEAEIPACSVGPQRCFTGREADKRGGGRKGNGGWGREFSQSPSSTGETPPSTAGARTTPEASSAGGRVFNSRGRMKQPFFSSAAAARLPPSALSRPGSPRDPDPSSYPPFRIFPITHKKIRSDPGRSQARWLTPTVL